MKYSLLLLLILSLVSCLKEGKRQKQGSESKTENPTVPLSKNEQPTKDQSKTKNESKVDTKANHYICYHDDVKKTRKIWIRFNADNIAIQVKYKGQSTAIDLVFERKESIAGGAHPTDISYYNELYEGKQNGVYKLTHSGAWDYVEYTRAHDGKVFNFTIDHDMNPYGSSPFF